MNDDDNKTMWEVTAKIRVLARDEDEAARLAYAAIGFVCEGFEITDVEEMP